MMLRNHAQLCNQLLGTNGLYEILAEECGELIQALMKMKRIENGDSTIDIRSNQASISIDEEIADVLICVARIQDKLQNYERVEFFINKKIDRTLDRLRNVIQKSTTVKSEIKVERKVTNERSTDK